MHLRNILALKSARAAADLYGIMHDQIPPLDSHGKPTVILHPDSRRFWTRVIPLGLLAMWVLRTRNGGGLGIMFVLGIGIIWLMYQKSSMTLDSEAFTYLCLGKRTSHRWQDVERFFVVEQRALGFITTNRYLGWNYSPAYKNYKRLAINRKLAGWVGMTEAMIKPVGFNVRELAAIMNQRLSEAKIATGANPS
jgi:hypothetical protein